MKSHCLKNIIPVVLLLAASVTFADPVLDMADSLKAAGFYDDAVTEYRRFLFFNESPEKRSPVYFRLGYCYAHLGDRDAALDALDQAIIFSGSDSLALKYHIDRAVVLAAMNEIARAGVELAGVIAGSNSEALKKRAGTLLFTVRVLQNDWPEAQIIYDTLLREENELSDSLESLLTKAAKDKYKSPGKAMLLSTFIPGLGQVYNGRWLSGLNALVLNFALGYLTFDLLNDREFASAFLTLAFLFQRYYNGNRGTAYNQAVEHNRHQDLRYEKEILNLFEQLLATQNN